MTYTPKMFLEDVRNFILDHNTSLIQDEARRIEEANIVYSYCSTDPRYIVERLLTSHAEAGESYGTTDFFCPARVSIFGEDHRGNKERLAFSFVHELAHVITGKHHNHDEVWAENARRLGICEVAYNRTNKHPDDKPEAWKWLILDRKLASYIQHLPAITDWQ